MNLKREIRFKVYEDDWSERQHKDPLSFGMEKWLNELAKKYDDVEIVGCSHGQTIDAPAGSAFSHNKSYETIYIIAKVIKYV